MCGLVGVFDTRGRRPVDPAVLGRMNDRLAHRGPDGDGLFLGAGIGLGHRRLAIIDLEGGRQPLANEDGSVVVVFNGEIYNFQDLADELEAAGHVFRTRSDTEVIVHAWEEWGADCVARFRGMFAFALWDQGAETLFLARDRMGKKPLHYALLADGRLVFGSEIKAVRAWPGVPSDLDPLAVEDFFAFGYVPDPRTVFAAIRKLPPAHALEWRRGAEPVLRRYWDWRPSGPPIRDADEAADELVSLLSEATRLRMVADVELGAFLSGGVDSSAVVALMAGLSARPVKTFAIGFDDRDHDESDHAARLAARYGTDHALRRADPDDVGLVDRLAGIFDEPFGDASAIPTFLVAALAREKVTVALSGDGGDELFAGYRRHVLHAHGERLRRALPLSLRAPLFGALAGLYPKADWAPRPLRAKATLRELSLDAAGAYAASVSVMDQPARRRLFSAGLRRQVGDYRAEDLIRVHMDAADTDDPIQAIQYVDLATWLPGGVLVKVDRASMANSLEVRAPLLDHRLAEWSARLDPGLKIAGTNAKRILKRAMEPLVDRDLLYRPKQGFSMPLSRWFRGALRERLDGLAGGALAESGLFDPAAIRLLAEHHLSGRRDHGRELWLLAMFDAFLRLENLTPSSALVSEIVEHQ